MWHILYIFIHMC